MDSHPVVGWSGPALCVSEMWCWNYFLTLNQCKNLLLNHVIITVENGTIVEIKTYNTHTCVTHACSEVRNFYTKYIFVLFNTQFPLVGGPCNDQLILKNSVSAT